MSDPRPIPIAPLSFFGVFLGIGITLMCLAIDMADHRAVQAAFYYGKVIEPARFLDLIQLLLVAMGAINYVLGLVSAFKSTAPPARKAADVIGFFIFVGNVAFNILLIKPTEVTIGLYFSSKDLPSPDLIHQLFQYHLVTLIASLALAAQQMISLKSTPKKDVAAKEKKQQ